MQFGEFSQRSEMQFQMLTRTIATTHAQIADINEAIGRDTSLTAKAPAPPPPVVSHRGPGALPTAHVAPAQPAQASAGDPMKYEESRGEWAAGLLKSMREARNCGMSSNIYTDFAQEIEETESRQSSIVLPSALPTPSVPLSITAPLAEAAPLWTERQSCRRLRQRSQPRLHCRFHQGLSWRDTHVPPEMGGWHLRTHNTRMQLTRNGHERMH